MEKWIENLLLEGETISLVPLTEDHTESLIHAAADGELWNLWYTSVPTPEKMSKYIAHALAQKTQGNEFPFAVWHKPTQRCIGSTRFYNLQPEHPRLEIGYTWYAQSFQRTRVNTECKRLLLEYAFETLSCIAVQFMADWHNLKSRKAITRLGAKQDGILRHHRRNPDGSLRDSVVFSITNTEWPGVKKSLTHHLSH